MRSGPVAQPPMDFGLHRHDLIGRGTIDRLVQNLRDPTAPAKSKAKPQQVTDLMRRPRSQTPLDADAKSTMTASEIRLHNSQVRLQKLNVAIAAGKYQHAATPCHACTRRLDHNTVPCAESITGDSASCDWWLPLLSYN